MIVMLDRCEQGAVGDDMKGEKYRIGRGRGGADILIASLMAILLLRMSRFYDGVVLVIQRRWRRK